MADVVVEFPVQVGEEAQLFGAYLSKFMEHFSDDADRWADQCDAPYVMVRSDPLQGREVKVLTFQLRSAAQAFSCGWARAKAAAVRSPAQA